MHIHATDALDSRKPASASTAAGQIFALSLALTIIHVRAQFQKAVRGKARTPAPPLPFRTSHVPPDQSQFAAKRLRISGLKDKMCGRKMLGRSLAQTPIVCRDGLRAEPRTLAPASSATKRGFRGRELRSGQFPGHL